MIVGLTPRAELESTDNRAAVPGFVILICRVYPAGKFESGSHPDMRTIRILVYLQLLCAILLLATLSLNA
jgi:hypothetical protein